MSLARALALAPWLMLGSAAVAAEVPLPARGHATNPVWNKDGSWLAFELNDFDGGIQLFAVSVSGTNSTGQPKSLKVPGASSSFSAGKSVATGSVWHPEGILVFEGAAGGSGSRLYFWQPGGQSPAELLNSGQAPGDLSWPAVSPDGTKMAFVSDKSGKGDVFLWDRASGGITQVVASPQSEASLAYSADGVLAFSRKNLGGEDLFSVRNGALEPRIGGNGDQTRPAWAGSTVVYFSSETGDGNWRIMASDAVGKRRVLAKDVRLPYRAAPALSPDGQWVLYGTSNAEAAGFIYATRVDGSRTVKIPTGHVACGEPSVVAAGDRLILAYTSLPAEGADWRQLNLVDVSDKLR
jgi:Tol biopolymer transport system component